MGSWSADDLEDCGEATEFKITDGIMTISDYPEFRAEAPSAPPPTLLPTLDGSLTIFLHSRDAHLTPPFIGQGLGAGLRDADNLAWKLAHVLTGQAGEDLLATYDTERRPHARAMVKKAVRVGWAMTGGQDRAAAIRRIALAAAIRSERIRQALASTATPRLKTGAPCPSRTIVGALRSSNSITQPRTPWTSLSFFFS